MAISVPEREADNRTTLGEYIPASDESEGGHTESAYRRAQQRAAQLRQVGAALGAALTVTAVSRIILDSAQAIFEAGVGLVVLLSEDGTTLRTAQVVGKPLAPSDPWHAFPLETLTPLADAVREQKLVLRPTDELFAVAHPEWADAGIETMGGQVAIPLMVDDRCLGGIALICPPERCQEGEEQTFLWTLAGQCALALDRARLYDEAMRNWETRKRAEDTPYPSGQIAQDALDSLIPAIAILDREGIILSVNTAWRRFAQENPPIETNVAEGANYLAVCDAATGGGEDAEQAHTVAAGIRAVIAGERELFTLEYPCHSPTEQRWFLLCVTAFPGKSPAAALVMHEDVTARKQAEESLARVNREIVVTWESMTDAFFVLNRQWEFTYINSHAAHLFEKKREALIGVSLWDAFPGALDTVFDREYHRAVEEQISVRFEGYYAPLGRWREVNAYPSSLGLSVYFRDITERKSAEEARERDEATLRASEQRQRLALESGRFGTFELDLTTGEYVELSPIARSQFALPADSLFSLQDFFRIVHPDDLGAVQDAASRASAVGARDFYSEYRIVLPDECLRWMSVHAALTYDEAELPSRMFGVTHDITDRKLTEQTTRMHSRMLNAIGQGVVATDLAGTIFYWNDFAEALYGWNSAEVLGRNIRDIMPNDMTHQLPDEIMLGLTRGESWSGEFVAQKRDGTTFPAFLTNTPVLDEAGRLVSIIGLATDITERNRARDALQAAEQEQRHLVARLAVEHRRLSEAQEVAKVGSWEREFKTDTLTWSEATYRIFDRNLTTFAHSHEAFMELVHPDDHAAVREAYIESIANRTPFAIEHRIQIRDGSTTFVCESGRTYYDEEGDPVRTIGTVQDVTKSHLMVEALRQSESEFRRIVETTQEGVIQVDADAKISYVNQRYCDMLGYTAAELLGRSFFEQMDEESADLARLSFERRRAGEMKLFDLRLRHKDGSVVWGLSSTTPLFADDGAVIGSFSMITDITERKKAEQEKEVSLAEALERADRDPLTGLLNHRAFYTRLDLESRYALIKGTTLAVVMLDLDYFKFFNDVYGHVKGDEVLRLVARKLKSVCRPSDLLARFGGDEFALLLPDVGLTTAGEIEGRIRCDIHGLFYQADGQETMIPVSIGVGAALFPDAGADCDEVLRKADERLRWAKTGGGVEQRAQAVRTDANSRLQGFSMLDALVTAVDNKDRYTRRHSESVMEYSLTIARALGLGEDEQQTIAVAALLHDVGKIGVPDAILRKPGRLTGEEFATVQMHPTMGATIVQAVPGLEATLDAVRYHHERWDGGGYPAGLRGEGCPLIARLIAVADAYSAMTTDRPYRRAMDRENALALLQAGAGTQWDPACVAAFVAATDGAA